jgi:hypothetical protein
MTTGTLTSGENRAFASYSKDISAVNKVLKAAIY